MLKAVLSPYLHYNKDKRKAMKIVSGFAGVGSIEINMKDKKWTVTGAIDAVQLVGKLREMCFTEIISVGPTKWAQNEDNKKKDDQDKKGSKVDLLPVYQKVVFKLDLRDDEDKKKVIKIVSGFAGVDSIDLNMRDKKMTVTGAIDPVELIGKLRKMFAMEIISVGSTK